VRLCYVYYSDPHCISDAHMCHGSARTVHNVTFRSVQLFGIRWQAGRHKFHDSHVLPLSCLLLASIACIIHPLLDVIPRTHEAATNIHHDCSSNQQPGWERCVAFQTYLLQQYSKITQHSATQHQHTSILSAHTPERLETFLRRHSPRFQKLLIHPCHDSRRLNHCYTTTSPPLHCTVLFCSRR
jgi:hypothetical protein